MARMRRRADLPARPCATCGRPFSWRRKWAKVWGEVRYCSERCRRVRANATATATATATIRGADAPRLPGGETARKDQ